ncbi:hypothetical protein VTN96DRAFT_575 [Rasamsonia emersonii]
MRILVPAPVHGAAAANSRIGAASCVYAVHCHRRPSATALEDFVRSEMRSQSSVAFGARKAESWRDGGAKYTSQAPVVETQDALASPSRWRAAVPPLLQAPRRLAAADAQSTAETPTAIDRQPRRPADTEVGPVEGPRNLSSANANVEGACESAEAGSAREEGARRSEAAAARV